MSEPSRRAVTTALGFTGLAVALGACETYGSPAGYQGAQGARSTTATDGGSPQASSGGAGAGGGKQLASKDEIPVDGGKVLRSELVVVTQPAQGQYAGFSAVCTHQGCTVASVRDGTINCPCHGSKFRIADGSVAAGPAPRPLAKVQLAVDANVIRLA
jgi:Rieske Fe-S protein